MPNHACQHCGYDLTGLPEDGVCPECGGPFGRGAPVAATPDTPIGSGLNGKAITLGVAALLILSCGGALSLTVNNPRGLIIATFCVTALCVFGAVCYWRARDH